MRTLPKNKSILYQLPRNERYDIGKQMRKSCPRESHAGWSAPANREDPVELVLQSNEGRIPRLVPLRHGRMAVSPFAFYRGASMIMAADLAETPKTGIYVQACGDAHLCNFGGFATPERNVIFSINDLDESLQAPWEWDVKRLASSFVLACRNNQFSDSAMKDIVVNCTRSYREHIAAFSEMKMMDLWYFSLTADILMSQTRDPRVAKGIIKRVEKEKNRSTTVELFPQIETGQDGSKIIKETPPFIFHWGGHFPGQVDKEVKDVIKRYHRSLPPGFASLLSRYTIKDVAIKVVGVGSVGTACWVILLVSGNGDTLFLQAKEAGRSVLERYAGTSPFRNNGERVVNGYRLMQPYSDPFLGWTRSKTGKDYYIRQLRDVKIKMNVEYYDKKEMMRFSDWCGQALALSHARSGDSAMISGYLGKSEVFDYAIAEFSIAYADQNEKDYASFRRAINSGKIEASFEN